MTTKTKTSIQQTKRRAALRPYRRAGLVLIPLDGKKPCHRDWPRRRYDTKTVIANALASGGNVGVRLAPGWITFDIDPRNGGGDSFERLCFDFGFDDASFPSVRTGSGGLHVFGRVPIDARFVGKLSDYRGVDILGVGRQVVAAGSTHPDSGRKYRWLTDRPALSDAPAIPAALLEAIQRPEHTSTATPGGEYDADAVAMMLAGLDPADYREHESWLRVMMACHHASGGDARAEFVAWSTADPQYSDAADVIEARWDSLHKERNDGVTAATLFNELTKRGRGDLIPPNDPTGEFETVIDDWLDGGPIVEDDGSAPRWIHLDDVTASNIEDTFQVVNTGGKIRALYRGPSPLDPRVRVPELWPLDEVGRALANRFVTIGGDNDDSKPVRMPLAKWWLQKKTRRSYDGLTFNAEAPADSNLINLWSGFGVRPEAGSWKRLRRHLREIIAADDAEAYQYILRWCAWGFQNPTRPAEVALALLSEGHGTGKGVFARALHRIYGAHGLHISQRSHLVGKFNAHFAQCSYLFCDEALWPGRPDDEGVLKALITEPSLMVEPKGINSFTMPNALKVIMASNNRWVVPAAGDERRYAVFEVSDARKQKRRYFQRLVDECQSGGLGAMLHDLLALDLNGWHPRNDIPQTAALAAQKMETAKPEVKWLGDILSEGVAWPGALDTPNVIPAGDFYDHVRTRRGLERLTDNQLAALLKGWGATRKRSNGSYWILPPLATMRAEFARRFPWWPAFEQVEDWRSAL